MFFTRTVYFFPRSTPAEFPSSNSAPSQFGFDEEDLIENKDKILELKFINIIGVHVYHGTLINKLTSLVDSYRDGIETAERLSKN